MATGRGDDTALPRSGSDFTLIIGLGNPGARYDGTRHNAGAEAVRRLARLLDMRLRHAPEYPAWLGRRPGLALAVPDAFMNESGPPVARLAARFDAAPPLLVSDDLDLPLGTLRFRTRGASGGHRGLVSVIAALGTGSFPRLKIGIGRPPLLPADGSVRRDDVTDWVLGIFAEAERETAERALDGAAAALRVAAEHGLARAMTEHSG